MRRGFWLLALGLGLAFAVTAQGQPPLAQTSSRVSGDRAWKHLNAQVNHGPRVPGSLGHAKTLAYLEAELRRAGGRVTVDRFTVRLEGKSYAMANLYADFGPTAPDGLQGGMLAAHWDTRPVADHDPEPANRAQPIPGANDGASGTAVLLEIARVLGETPPQTPLRIAFWDGEDLGTTDATMFYGSRFYVRNRPLPRWGILLDMVGDRDLVIPQEGYSAHHAPELTRRIWDAAKLLGYASYFPRREGPAINDDHLPFLGAGVPFVDLIDFDYPYWHTLGDKPERCSAKSLEIVGNVVLHVVRELDRQK